MDQAPVDQLEGHAIQDDTVGEVQISPFSRSRTEPDIPAPRSLPARDDMNGRACAELLRSRLKTRSIFRLSPLTGGISYL